MLNPKHIALIALAVASPTLAEDNWIVEQEKPALAATTGTAERDGKTLRLHVASGKTVKLTDGPSCFEERQDMGNCTGFEFIRHDRARRLFIVRQYYYEGESYAVVDDRTGDVSLLQAEPQLSPKGDTIVELVYGESGYYSGDPRVSVWRRAGGKFTLEWSKPITDRGGGGEASFSVLGWASNDRIDILSDTGGSMSGDEGTTRFSIERAAKGWQLVDR